MHYLRETAENVSADVHVGRATPLGEWRISIGTAVLYSCACFFHNEYPFNTIAIHYPCTPFTLPQSGICHTLVVGGSLTFQDYACCFCCCCYRRRRTRPLKTLAKGRDWKTYSVTQGVDRQFPVRSSRLVEPW